MKKFLTIVTLSLFTGLIYIVLSAYGYAPKSDTYQKNSGIELETASFSECVGAKRIISAKMECTELPTITSSDDSVASGYLLNETSEDGYLFEIHCNAVGTAEFTISNGDAVRSLNVTVTERNPLVLDTTQYTTAVGNTYYFAAKSGTDDISSPVPVVANPEVAEVTFSKKINTGEYLFRVKALKPGTTMVGAAICGIESTFFIQVVNEHSIELNPLLQNPELPAGCEITALTNVLNHYGYSVSKTYMADSMLNKDNSSIYQYGKLYMANPAKVFVGDPRTPRFGCFSQPIVDAANKYLKTVNSQLTAKNISGSEPCTLYHYVANDIPVLTWATMGMSEPKQGTSWYDKDTSEPITWISGEHCVVLIGFGDNTVTVSDPLKGITSYSRSLFEKRYIQMSKQAVILKS